MRLRLFILLSVWLFTVPSWAMQHWTDSLIDRQGNAIVSATVHVYIAGTTTHATIYSDNGFTVKTQPFNTAQDGSYTFYAPNGRYDLVFVKSGYNFPAANTAGVALYDIMDGNSWPSGVTQIFSPNSVNAGLNYGVYAGTPGTLNNGDVWYDSTVDKFRCYEGGAAKNCITTFAGSNLAPDNATYLTTTANGVLTSEVVVPPSDDTTMIGNGSTWAIVSIPNCLDTGGQHLNYATATNTLSCGSSGTGGSGGAFSGISSGTNTGAAMVVGSGASMSPTGSGLIAATNLRPAVTTVNAVNSPYTATTLDELLVCDGTAGARVINLPAASTRVQFDVKHLGTNTCTIAPAGTDLIDQVNASVIMRNNNSGFTIKSDGVSAWYIGG